jgi:hypothetical protein
MHTREDCDNWGDPDGSDRPRSTDDAGPDETGARVTRAGSVALLEQGIDGRPLSDTADGGTRKSEARGR